jgi:hypothetical protein
MHETELHAALTTTVHPLAPEHRSETSWRQAVLTELCAVEELLDGLDCSGHTQRRLTIIGDTFVLRWREIDR